MGFKEYLQERLKNEQYGDDETIDDIVNGLEPDIKELLDDNIPDLLKSEPTILRNVMQVYDKALLYRNIERGVDYFKDTIRTSNILPVLDGDETWEHILTGLNRWLNWAQVQATRIAPDYYV